MKCPPFFNKIIAVFWGKDDTQEHHLSHLNIPPAPMTLENNEQCYKPVVAEPEDALAKDAIKQSFDTVDVDFSNIAPIEGSPIIVDENQMQEDIVETKGNYEKLMSETINTIKFFDRYAAQQDNPEVKKALDGVCRNLIENLTLSGCISIDEPNGIYDMSRHMTVPIRLIPEGTEFTKLIRAGVEYEGEVKLLAIVEL